MLPVYFALALAPVVLPGKPGEADPRAQAVVRKVQGWLDTVEGRLGDIVTGSQITPPEIIPERDGGRRLVFKVSVSFNRGFYDRFRLFQQDWPDSRDPAALGQLRTQLRRLNRYGIFLGLYSAGGDLIAKAPVVKNPYFGNMLEDYYEDRAGDLVPVPHSQIFRDKPESLEPMLRNADLAAIALPAATERFVPVFQAEGTTRKEIVLQVAPEDISQAKTYRLEMEATDG